MTIQEDIRNEVLTIFRKTWDRREGRVVPNPDNPEIALGNDSVVLKATILYADLADSTSLVKGFKDSFAAEIFKSYLITCCRIIRLNEGEIVAFDGDRVMGVFTGESKNTSAVKAGLQINFAVQKIINPSLKECYQTSYAMSQSVGIDTGEVLVARAGMRNANDLIWVGKCANYAAKLCSLREGGFNTFITEDVFNGMNDSSKYGGTSNQLMWEKRIWNEQGIGIYRSSWWWSIE